MKAYSDKDTHDEFISSNNLVDVAFLCTVWACSDFPGGIVAGASSDGRTLQDDSDDQKESGETMRKHNLAYQCLQ